MVTFGRVVVVDELLNSPLLIEVWDSRCLKPYYKTLLS